VVPDSEVEFEVTAVQYLKNNRIRRAPRTVRLRASSSSDRALWLAAIRESISGVRAVLLRSGVLPAAAMPAPAQRGTASALKSPAPVATAEPPHAALQGWNEAHLDAKIPPAAPGYRVMPTGASASASASGITHVSIMGPRAVSFGHKHRQPALDASKWNEELAYATTKHSLPAAPSTAISRASMSVSVSTSMLPV